MLRRVYRSVLRLHPPGFRRRFGDEMLSIFDQIPGRFAALRLLLDGFVSLTGSGHSDRNSGTRSRPHLRGRSRSIVYPRSLHSIPSARVQVL